jgi:hypothetical protein
MNYRIDRRDNAQVEKGASMLAVGRQRSLDRASQGLG